MCVPVLQTPPLSSQFEPSARTLVCGGDFRVERDRLSLLSAASPMLTGDIVTPCGRLQEGGGRSPTPEKKMCPTLIWVP